MAARRLILAMLVLLVLSTILATLVPVDNRQGDETDSSSTTEAEASPPSSGGQLVKHNVAVDGPRPERIELERGDQLELTVTSARLADRVEIPAFGDSDFVDPDFPAHFDVLALETGTFPVRLDEADRVIARIQVGAGQRKSRDSPGSSKASSTPGASPAS